MTDVIVKDDVVIENLIYEIRGKQVMLDSDLAKLYECANGTKTINLAVKRHINRFPERFMFQLTKEEYNILRFQFETANNMSRTLPYVFTEQGVAMLATVLRTGVAEEISIRIMDAFVAMRHYIDKDLIEQKYINSLVLENHEKIKILEESFSKFEEKRKVNDIYFNGQIYDAYSKIQDIFKSVTKRLIIIDAYADNTILDIIKRLNIEVIIITKKNNLLTDQDITKYNKQYHNLKVVFNNSFHDRYFLIDNKLVYHCGTSINRIGYKTFSINLISDEEVCNLLISKVNKII
ncbi:MAG: ORF6N domain-containing protein [Bacilli bacterium]|nr:ORF6N domain-containing protein [Bacilli bacterium]